ncbi:dual specificity protein phosphatase PHS1-like [Iris pallida]|uniref:Dual specificity protein phosphatase PHS1-like n=1 Tax=Iris pallida TaxID=29817 RepID=A0AAX6E3X7_IRIPA|nr:dual specificity protein phosphatase PHS1-like [Iris pallida]
MTMACCLDLGKKKKKGKCNCFLFGGGGESSGSERAGLSFEEWRALVRKRSATSPRASAAAEESAPTRCCELPDCGSCYGEMVDPQCYDEAPELSLWERLGNAAMLDIESSDLSWDALSSLYHTKHTSSAEQSEDELNKALELTVNSGGIVFYAMFDNTFMNDDLLPKEAAAVIKIASSRMATQSERLGYEFAKWLGVRTPQARVIHSSSPEWQQIKDAAEKSRDMAVSVGDEVGEWTSTELLEALELSRCLFLMNYVHGTPLLENADAFGSRDIAGTTAAALGRVLMLDLILRNEDRLPCRQLGWRGNNANLLFADKVASPYMDAMEEAYDSAVRRYKLRIIKSLQKERRSISVNGRLSSHNTEEDPNAASEVCVGSTMKQAADEIKHSDYHIVAIDSGVPRRPPAGKRAQDQENYPKVVELLLNNFEYSSNLLYEISGGKLGFPKLGEVDSSDSRSSLSDTDMVAVIHEFRGGFRAALRDLQGFHIFLLTIYQKLDGLLRLFLSIINRSTGESDKDDDSPSHSNWSSLSSPFTAPKERSGNEITPDSSDFELQKAATRLSNTGTRESSDFASPILKDNWNMRFSRGNGEVRSLRLTMKLRDFNKFAKVDAELNKELEQWNDLLRTDVVKLCHENNFNSGFFEGNDNNIVVDAYEFKVRLEHILERISLISDAASTERPSPITRYLFIGGALAARSMYTLQQLGITHVLCLCSNEIGQSDSQYPDLFEYRNFSINDDDDADISELFEEVSDFIDYVEYLGGKVLVHCFEGKSRSATAVLAYLMLRKKLTLSEAWNTLKKVHRRAQPNDGFARILVDLDKKLHGKVSMEWQQRRPVMKVCPICGKNAGLSSSSLKLHLQKSHRKISSGSVDSAMTLEIEKALEALKISRGGSVSPTQKQSQEFIEAFSN